MVLAVKTIKPAYPKTVRDFRRQFAWVYASHYLMNAMIVKARIILQFNYMTKYASIVIYGDKGGLTCNYLGC